VVIPAIHEAQARRLTAVFRDKEQTEDDASGGKRNGGCSGSLSFNLFILYHKVAIKYQGGY
jgi:hypothetical protein